MKSTNYLLLSLSLVFSSFTAYAQCGLSVTNQTIVCGDSIRLEAEPTWSSGLDNLSPADLYGVFFTDDLTGYTVGLGGTVHKTIDGGSTWFSQPSNTNNSLSSVFFLNATTGVAVGQNGTIIRTINGGDTWNVQVSGVTAHLNKVFFTDATTGIAVGADGTIIKTIDGGITWSVKTSNVTNNLSSVHFPNLTVGYVSGEIILKTVDGGETWSVITSSFGGAVFFTSSDVGFSTGFESSRGVVYKTTDGGVTWKTTFLSPTYAYGAGSIYFTDSNTGYVGGVYRIFKTTDGGNSWKEQTANLMNVQTIHFPSSKIGYATGFVPPMSLKTIKYVFPDIIEWTPSTDLSSTSVLNPVASPKSTTTYKITTTAGSCIATKDVTITVDPLTVDAGTDKTIICGGNVQLNDLQTNYKHTQNLIYSWSPATGLSAANIANPIVTITQTTKYYITITTPNGCTATDSLTVLVDPFIADAGVNKTVICGDSVQLDNVITNYSGSGLLTYAWSPSDGLNASNIAAPIAAPNKTTKYFITVSTPNGCVSTDSITVSVAPLIIDAGNDKALICGASVQLDSAITNYTGREVLSYAWLPVSGLNAGNIPNPTATVINNTLFNLTVTTSNGCIAKDSITVLVVPLIANAGTDKTHFCGDSVQLDKVSTNFNGTGNLIYAWQPATGLNNPTIADPTTTGAGITYTVTVSTPNGCVVTDEVKVELEKMNPIEICVAGVDSTDKNVIVWNNAGSLVIDSFYIYKETAISNNYIKIGSVAGNKGSFKDLNSLPNVKSDKYKISVIDSCGLESSQSNHHKTMHLSISKGVGTSWNLIWEKYEGFSVPTYNIYRGTDKNNLQFIDAVSGGSNQFTNYNPPPGDLYYQVEVVNPNTCGTSGDALRSNVATSGAVGINETPGNIFIVNVFPNPANEKVMIDVGNATIKNMTLNIYNALGAVVKATVMEQNKQQIDVSDLPNGLYMIEIRSSNGSSRSKVMIEK